MCLASVEFKVTSSQASRVGAESSVTKPPWPPGGRRPAQVALQGEERPPAPPELSGQWHQKDPRFSPAPVKMGPVQHPKQGLWDDSTSWKVGGAVGQNGAQTGPLVIGHPNRTHQWGVLTLLYRALSQACWCRGCPTVRWGRQAVQLRMPWGGGACGWGGEGRVG